MWREVWVGCGVACLPGGGEASRGEGKGAAAGRRIVSQSAGVVERGGPAVLVSAPSRASLHLLTTLSAGLVLRAPSQC